MESAAARPRRRRRRQATAALLSLAVVLAGLLLWSQRRPIASGYIDEALAARGVVARYRIAGLAPGRQELVDIRIGDPAAPDLTAASAVVELRYGLGGVELRRIRARGVRLRARLVDGRVSLGSVDRLLPPPGGAPLALPALAVDLADARIRLETPAGAIGLALDGAGRLSDGFRGRLAAIAPRLSAGGCAAERPTAYVALRVRDGRPHVEGPLRARRISCAGTQVEAPAAAVTAMIGRALDSWDGRADLAAARATGGGATLLAISGRIGFEGVAAATGGPVQLAARAAALPGARGGRLLADGRYRIGGAAGPGFEGRLAWRDVALAPVPRLDALAQATAGTPLAPLGRQLGVALANAAAHLSLEADLAAAGARVALRRLDAASASGARFRFAGERGSGLAAGRLRLDGAATLAGGGLPRAEAVLLSGPAGLAGTLRFAPYSAGDARLALAPLRFAQTAAGLRFATRALLDGPVAGGRVEGLALPLAGQVGAAGFALAPGCVPVRFAALALAGFRFANGALRACPLAGGRIAGADGAGVRIDGLRLAGRAGRAPASVAAASFTAGPQGFAARGLALRIGEGPAPTLLGVETLAGTGAAAGLGGRFAGAAGRIGAVPLLLSGAVGDWRLAGGRLTLAGGLRIADSAPARRFEPMAGKDVTLVLEAGRIDARGTLVEPVTGTAVAAVTLRHDLASGAGGARLDVRDLAFTPRFQPERLTPLSVGIVANVRGRVAGEGLIRWDSRGVVSEGRFGSEGLDLAAAFGPVTGLSGAIRFTDLLGLRSAPGQRLTLATVNPGIEVKGGTVGFQLLGADRIAIEGGRWPFAGGTLALQPTLLHFGEGASRRLAFTVTGLDAARFIEQLGLENVAATGLFDGTVPMVFDPDGGRIVGGLLAARPGGGTLAYVGEVSKAQLGTFGKLAFDALKSMRYRQLSIRLDGALDGEIVSLVRFDGVNQQPLGPETMLSRPLKGLPFRFNIALRAPFRALVGSARAYQDPGLLLRRGAVQPSASGAVPGGRGR